MSELTKQLRIKAGMINLGERIEWGSETALMETAANRIDHLEAELAKLRAGQEPVLYVNGEHLALALDNPDKEGRSASTSTVKGHYCDTPLYTAPQPSAVPDGYALVPRKPTPAMRVIGARDCSSLIQPDQAEEVWTAMLGAVIVPAEYAFPPSTPATVQGDGWIPVSERLPQIKQVLSEKCTLEGREIPTLYRSGMVLTFDGRRVSAGIVEWFHSKSPLNNVTHWMPLPAAPSIAAARQEGGKV